MAKDAEAALVRHAPNRIILDNNTMTEIRAPENRFFQSRGNPRATGQRAVGATFADSRIPLLVGVVPLWLRNDDVDRGGGVSK